jgi:predicted ArsR family transcriptional regulator
MSLTNPFGDAQITNPLAMRALAHPTRLAILTHLQRDGPATATTLAPHVGATPSVTSWHLRHLAGFGLVIDADPSEVPGDRRQRWWKAVAKGFTFGPGTGPDYQLLSQSLVAMSQEQVNTWVSDIEPILEPEWQQAAGLSNTGVAMTPDELTSLAQQIDELIAPYLHRATPPDTRMVRILRHYLPEASS